MSAAGQVIAVNFRSAPAPVPAGDGGVREYHAGDPVPAGWYVHDPDPGHPEDPKYLVYDTPYEETIWGRLDALDEQVRTLRRKLAVSARRAGAR